MRDMRIKAGMHTFKMGTPAKKMDKVSNASTGKLSFLPTQAPKKITGQLKSPIGKKRDAEITKVASAAIKNFLQSKGS